MDDKSSDMHIEYYMLSIVPINVIYCSVIVDIVPIIGYN